MTDSEASSQKRVLLTSKQQPKIHPLATIIHDANNKLQSILVGFTEREDEIDEHEFVAIITIGESVRDKCKALLIAIREGVTELDAFAQDLTYLHEQLKSVLPLLQTTETRKHFIPRRALACCIDEFDMLMKRGLQFIQAQPPEDLPVLGNISEYISGILYDYQHQHPQICFHSIIDTDCETFFHPPSIKRALENLLNNAVQALPTAGGEISIKLQNKSYDTEGRPFTEIEEGPYISIEIADNGSGISEEVLDKLQHSTITTKEDGSGFGLVSARKSMIRHKGHLIIESKKGNGTTVTVLLPNNPDVKPTAMPSYSENQE